MELFDNNAMMQQQMQKQLMDKVLHSPNIVCKCGCKTFVEASVLKKVSALVSPTGKEDIFPVPVYICSKCGEIPVEFLEKGNAKMILGEEKIPDNLISK